MEKHHNIKMHSEELNEVLGTPPGWLVRWGTSIAFFAFLMLLLVAFLVKYSDIVKAPLILKAPNPPVNLIADRSALLEAVLVADNEMVEEGDLILVYSSAANMLDIDSLEKSLKYFSGEVYASDLEEYIPFRNPQLGVIQEKYSDFLKNFDSFTYGEVSNNDQKTIARYNQQISDIENSIEVEEAKREGIQLRLDIAKKDVAHYQKVYNSDVNKYRTLIGQTSQKIKSIEQEFENLDADILKKRNEIKNIKRSIEDTRQKTGESNAGLILQIRNNIEDLKGQIKIWKKKNLLTAPIDGRVIFYKEFDNENQTVEDGTKILQIIPPGEVGEMYGSVNLPQFGSGNVAVGQEVVIKFDNYPSHQWGMINGRVKSKSDFPQEDETYKVEVELTNGLKTSRGKEIIFKQGMQGTAEIVTKEKRFLYRLFENIF